MMNNNKFRLNASPDPGYTERGKQGSKWIATGDLFLDEPPVQPERTPELGAVSQQITSAVGEKALNPWQVPGYRPGGASPRSVAEVADLVQKSQNAGAHDREVLAAREEIGRLERGENPNTKK